MARYCGTPGKGRRGSGYRIGDRVLLTIREIRGARGEGCSYVLQWYVARASFRLLIPNF